MRIVLLNQYYAPDEAATAQILSDLGAHLAASGHSVHAICCDRSYASPGRRYPRRETIDGVEIHRVRTSSFGRRSRVWRLIDYCLFIIGAALQLLRHRDADVVVALTTPPMIAAVPLAVRLFAKFKLVFWSMDVYPDLAFKLGALKPGSWAGRLFSRLAHTILKRSDVVIALGDSMAVHLREAGAQRVEVVHNWADEEVITPLVPLGRPSRETWGWTRRFVVLYSGNLGLAHEFDTVMKAAAKLEALMPNVLFAFIGVGPRLREVQAAARALKNVEFREYVERSKLGESLTAADVHLVTMRPDVAGLLVPSKIYGILAAGRPTIYIGPASGEVDQLLREGHCGASIRNGDVDGVVSVIHDYACDPSRRDREGERARAFFESRFTKRKSLSALRHVIESAGSLNDSTASEP